ncbi:MAG: VanZ family protein [Ignavibacteriales bacterium]|nr:VanZ family protein [Ignavibacteriales bacterium]
MQSNSFSNLLYKYISTNTLYCVYLPLIIYWITLFVLTTIPVDAVPQIFNNQDKIEHFVAYGALAFLLTLALSFQKKSKLISSKAFLFTFIFILSYGAVDELHQLFVPGRDCDLLDWLADSIGGSIGIGMVYLFLRSQLKIKDKVVTK